MDGLPRELSTSRCGEKRRRLALPSFSRDLSDLSLLMDETDGRLQSSAYPTEVACGNGGSTHPDLCTQPVLLLPFQTKIRMIVPSFFLDFHLHTSYMQ